MYPRPPEESQNAGKFAWQIIYRTKEKCLEKAIGYVIKKLTKWFGRDRCVKLKQIEAKSNQNVPKMHVRVLFTQRACWLSPWLRCQQQYIYTYVITLHVQYFNSVVLVAYIFGTDWSIYFKFGHDPKNASTVSLQENLRVFNQC